MAAMFSKFWSRGFVLSGSKMSDYIYFIYAGLGSAAVSAIFYTVYRNREGAIRSLQVRIFSIDYQLTWCRFWKLCFDGLRSAFQSVRIISLSFRNMMQNSPFQCEAEGSFPWFLKVKINAKHANSTRAQSQIANQYRSTYNLNHVGELCAKRLSHKSVKSYATMQEGILDSGSLRCLNKVHNEETKSHAFSFWAQLIHSPGIWRVG